MRPVDDVPTGRPVARARAPGVLALVAAALWLIPSLALAVEPEYAPYDDPAYLAGTHLVAAGKQCDSWPKTPLCGLEAFYGRCMTQAAAERPAPDPLADAKDPLAAIRYRVTRLMPLMQPLLHLDLYESHCRTVETCGPWRLRYYVLTWNWWDGEWVVAAWGTPDMGWDFPHP